MKEQKTPKDEDLNAPLEYNEDASYNPEDIDKEEKPSFSLILQNKGISAFNRVDSSLLVPFYDPKTNSTTGNFGDVTIRITGMPPEKIVKTTHTLLDALLLSFTKQNQYKTKNPKNVVSFHIDDFLKLTNSPISKPNRDKKRAKIREQLNILYNLSLDYESHDKELIRRERLCTSYDIVNSVVYFEFNPSLAQKLVNSYFIDLPLSLFALPDTSSNAYYIGRKLAEQYTYDSNRVSGTYNILSVQKILDSCPTIPSEEKVASSGRNYKMRITNPFIKAMKELESINFLTWNFCNSKKLPLTEKQKQNFGYRTFIKCYVTFTLLEEKDGNIVEHIPDNEKRKDDKKKKNKNTDE